MTLSIVKSKKPTQLQSDVLNVFKTLMLFPNECEESDVQMFHTRLRAKLQKSLISEIKEKRY